MRKSRVVVKDIASGSPGSDARSMGISSPTPSSEALMVILAAASKRGYVLASADVASAEGCDCQVTIVYYESFGRTPSSLVV